MQQTIHPDNLKIMRSVLSFCDGLRGTETTLRMIHQETDRPDAALARHVIGEISRLDRNDFSGKENVDYVICELATKYAAWKTGVSEVDLHHGDSPHWVSISDADAEEMERHYQIGRKALYRATGVSRNVSWPDQFSIYQRDSIESRA